MIWKTLRVAEQTLADLQRYRDALQVQVGANRKKYARFGPSFRVSLDQAIAYLIEQKDKHTARSRGFTVPGERPKDSAVDEHRRREAEADEGR
jgi:hypothetical protein